MVDSYVRKFFMTFGLMVIIGLALLLKIMLGAVYNLGYRCTHSISDKPIVKDVGPKCDSRVKNYFSEVKSSMDSEVVKNIHEIFEDVKRMKSFTNNRISINYLSFIINNKIIDGGKKEKAVEKWNNNFIERSKIVKKDNNNDNIHKANNQPDGKGVSINFKGKMEK